MGKRFFCWFGRKIAGILAFIFFQIIFHISLISNSTVQRWIGLFMLQMKLDEKQVTLKKIEKGGSDIKNKFQKEEGGTFCL